MSAHAALEGSGSGLVGWWKLDEGSGTVADDASGNGNNGTLVNGPVWTEGKVGSQSLRFDGSDDMVSADGTIATELNGSSEATISFWMKWEGGGAIVSRWGSQRQFILYPFTSTALRVNWRVGGSGTGGTTLDHIGNAHSSVLTSSWHHIALVYKDPVSYIYIDGALNSSMTGPGGALNTGVTDPLRIGNYSTNYFMGIFDDVRLYKRGLSAAEIQELYGIAQVTLPPFVISENGSCGGAAKNYSVSESFPAGSYCSAGTASPASPSEPIQGGSSAWSCLGSNSGSDSLCTATRSAPSVPSGPRSWYVDASASGNIHDGMSWATAWQNVDKISGVQGGDTVYISGGPSGSSKIYYFQNWRPIGGTNGSSVTYRVSQDPSHNGVVIFDGSRPYTGGEGDAIYLVNNNVVISGNVGGEKHIKLQNFSRNGVLNSPGLSNIKIEYMELGEKRIELTESITNVEIGHVHIKTNFADHAVSFAGLRGNNWGTNSFHDSVLELGSAEGGVSVTGGGGVDGIQWGSAVDIYNNSFLTYYTDSPYIAQHQDAIQSAGRYMRIYNNYFANMLNSAIFLDNISTTGEPLQDIYIYNNVFELTAPGLSRTTARPIETTCESYCASINNIRIYNNTIVDYPNMAGINMAVRNPIPAPVISNVEIKNNILHNTRGISVQFNPQTGVTLSNNSVTAASSAEAPKFTWYAPFSKGNDFHLLGNDTSARLSGQNIWQYFTTDKDGRSRPQSGPWDLGAYQYVSNGSCTGPSAFFVASTASGYEPLTVNFDASGSVVCSGTLSYSWDFGDNSPQSSSASPTHIFTSGSHTVTLTVTNSLGKSASISRIIVASPSPVPNLVLGINFDNNVLDWSGKGNTVAWSQAPCYGSGMINGSGCFDGTSFVVVKPDPMNDLLESPNMSKVTLAGWAKKASINTEAGILGKYSVYGLSVQPQGLYAYIGSNDSENIVGVSSSINADTQWHHYAMTYEGTKMSLYLDGKQILQKNLVRSFPRNAEQPLYIGIEPFYHSNSGPFKGSLDDIRIYNEALSATQIEELFNSRKSTMPPILNAISPSGVLDASTKSVQLSVSTNISAGCRYSTTPSVSYSNMTSAFLPSADGKTHIAQAPNLVPGSYTYYVKCQDNFGNANTTDEKISFVIPQSPSGANLVLHYDFKNDFTQGSLSDLSAIKNNAVCQNNGFYINNTNIQSDFVDADQCPTKTTGLNGGQAALFKGSVCRLDSTYFYVPKNAAIDNLESGTISIFANYSPSTDPSFQVPYSGFSFQRLMDTYSRDFIGSWAIAKDLGVTGNPATSFIVNTGTNPPFNVSFDEPGVNNSWNHYAVSWDRSFVNIYLNGLLKKTVPKTGFTSLKIGGYLALGALKHPDYLGNNIFTNNCVMYGEAIRTYNYPSGTRFIMPNAGFLIGKLGDIRIYNKTLSASEVAGIYDDVLGSPGVPEPPISAPDTTSPTISIILPTNGVTISNSVSLSGSASDNVGVIGVQFKLDGVNLGTELTIAPYSGTWNTQGVSNGLHTLTAVARDAAGNTRTSNSVTVTVSNTVAQTTIPPSGGSPTGGNTTTPGGTTQTPSGGTPGSNTTTGGNTAGLPPTGTFTPTVPQIPYQSLGGNCYSTTTRATSYTFTGAISPGMYHPDIKELQKFLNVSGFKVANTGPGSPGQESTYYGSLTKAAVTRFQIANNITTDPSAFGLIGPRTRAKLNELSSKPITSTICPTATATPLISSTSQLTAWLTLGNTHREVLTIQKLLNAKGYTVSLQGAGSPGNETTYFGPATQNALRRFQCAKFNVCSGTPSTTGYGATGPRTRAELSK